MAVDDHLAVVAPIPTFSSSSSTSITGRRRCIQVATDNSSAFIRFPTNSRQSLLLIPTHRLRTNLSTTQPALLTTNTKSISSNTPSSSNVSTDHELSHSQQRFNPILNNPLLNHRREQPKSLPVKISSDLSQTTRLSLSSKPLKTNQISTNRPKTAPVVARRTDNSFSNEQIIADDNKSIDQQEIPCLDKMKHDYIIKWLDEVQQAIYFTETYSKTKR